jgi:hypothetical protein
LLTLLTTHATYHGTILNQQDQRLRQGDGTVSIADGAAKNLDRTTA